MLKYALIGFGGLGKLHLGNLLRLEQERPGEIKLCAICGTTKEAATGAVQTNLGTVDMSNVDFSECGFYQDYKDMFAAEKPDFVVTALPTAIHEEVAVYALEQGVHVFSEKPMALTVEGCDRMIETAKRMGKKLMIGQSLRFSPGYTQLREYIRSGVYGKVYRAEFSRYSAMPKWTWNNWILDPKQSGGCVLDMHIHDVDVINWLFGKPKAVSSVGTAQKCQLESVFTRYEYGDKVVSSAADWSLPDKFPFTFRTMVNFEKATVELTNGKMTVHTDAESFSPELSGENSHYIEMKTYLAWLLADRCCKDITSPESVRDSVMLALAETASIEAGKPVQII